MCSNQDQPTFLIEEKEWAIQLLDLSKYLNVNGNCGYCLATICEGIFHTLLIYTLQNLGKIVLYISVAFVKTEVQRSLRAFIKKHEM